MVSYQIINKVLQQAIIEAAPTRRDFLKSSGASLIGALLNRGVPQPVALKAAAGHPVKAMIDLGVGWDMSRGAHSDLSQSARDIHYIFSMFNRLGVPVHSVLQDGVQGLGTDEYSYFVSLSPEILAKLEGHIQWSNTVNSDEDDEIQHTLNLLPQRPLMFRIVDGVSEYDQTQLVSNPVVDFWNNYARFDSENAARNWGWIEKMKSLFDKQIMNPVDFQNFDGEISWQQLEQMAKDPDWYNRQLEVDDRIQYDDEIDDEMDDTEGDINDGSTDPNEPKVNVSGTNVQKLDYDDYLKSQWDNEGGFVESIHSLYKRIKSRQITLREALQWVNDLNWPAEAQQRIAIAYIQNTIIE